eukprot:11858673-Karenia_brevis.AAC.1
MAAKLRGMLTALDLGLTGIPIRGALAALTARQYWEQAVTITPALYEALWYVFYVVCHQSPKSLTLFAHDTSKTIVYTDASLEQQ